jgi:hypothetical protein
MISCSLSKFFFYLPKIEGGFYACQTAGPLTQQGAVETADGLVFLGIPPLETHFDFLVSPERARARLKKLSTTR